MKFTTREIVFTAMFTAITAVLSILTIPTPSGVPITLQTFAIALCGFVIGYKLGTISVVLYVLIGLIGVPVYAGMSAGPGVLFGASGGYIFGFILMALFCGLGMRFSNKLMHLLFGIIGLACCHVLGVIQLKVVLSMTWMGALMAGTVPFLVKDVISIIGAYVVALAVKRALKAAKLEAI